VLALVEVFFKRQRAYYKTAWLISYPAVLAMVVLPWYVIMVRKFGFGFLLEDEVVGWLEKPRLGSHGLIFLPYLVWRIFQLPPLKLFFRGRGYQAGRWVLVSLVFLVGLNWFGFRRATPLKNEIYLTHYRQTVSRTGTNPNLIVGKFDPVLVFYSDVPFFWLGQSSLEKRLLEEGTSYFAFVPAKFYDQFRLTMGQHQIGSRVVIASEELLLIEKW